MSAGAFLFHLEYLAYGELELQVEVIGQITSCLSRV